MLQLRKMVAVCSLSLAAILATTELGRIDPVGPAMAGVALLLALSAWGVARGRPWGPWFALGTCIAATPLLCVLALAPATAIALPTFELLAARDPSLGARAGGLAPAVLAALALLAVGSLLGELAPKRGADGRAAALDARALRRLGFAFTLGAACLGGVLLLAGATWSLRGPAALMHGRGLAYSLTAALLGASLGLLAARKSAGLLVLAVAMVPMTAIGVGLAERAVEAGSRWGLLFALVCFVPAWVSAAMCLSRFAAPIWSLLRGR